MKPMHSKKKGEILRFVCYDDIVVKTWGTRLNDYGLWLYIAGGLS